MKDDQGGRGRKDLVVERDDVIKNIIDSIRQHCNLPWPVKRAINVTINTAALKPQALFVVAMAAVKHPRFRLGNFILSFVSPHFTCLLLSPFSSLFSFTRFPFSDWLYSASLIKGCLSWCTRCRAIKLHTYGRMLGRNRACLVHLVDLSSGLTLINATDIRRFLPGFSSSDFAIAWRPAEISTQTHTKNNRTGPHEHVLSQLSAFNDNQPGTH